MMKFIDGSQTSQTATAAGVQAAGVEALTVQATRDCLDIGEGKGHLPPAGLYVRPQHSFCRQPSTQLCQSAAVNVAQAGNCGRDQKYDVHDACTCTVS